MIVFDAFKQAAQADYLDVSASGSTVIFTTHFGGEQIASIAMNATFSPAQTITYSDGTSVDITLVGTSLAINGLSFAAFNAANLVSNAAFVG